jgi:hypothetical protein
MRLIVNQLFGSLKQKEIKPNVVNQAADYQFSEADNSPPSSAELKNGRAVPPLPHMSSWHTA